MSHFSFVAIAYGVSALTILALTGWIMLDQRARRAELAELEASGIRRRSDVKSNEADDER
jgi:heme exporter protein D